MAKYIEREATVSGLDRVIENLRKQATTNFTNRAVDLVQYSRDYIQNLPAADVVPVVRCWECKHNDIQNDGLIDIPYRGSIKIKLYNHGDTDYMVHRGDKISQLVIIDIRIPHLKIVDELDETERGNNGFGSTGR